MKWLLYICAGIAGVVTLAVLVLFVMSQRSGAGQMQASLEIARTPEELWPWLAEPEKLKSWVSWLVEIRGPAAQPGATQVWVMEDHNNNRQRMEIEGTITEYLPPRRMTVRVRSVAGFTGEQLYEITDAGNRRSRVTVGGKYQFSHWFVRLMEPLVTPQAEKKLVADLARLKSLAEQPGAAAARP